MSNTYSKMRFSNSPTHHWISTILDLLRIKIASEGLIPLNWSDCNVKRTINIGNTSTSSLTSPLVNTIDSRLKILTIVIYLCNDFVFRPS